MQVAVLEDQDEDAEDGAQGEHVHQHRFQSEHDRAGHQEENDERRRDHSREDERQVSSEARLEVDEPCRLACDADVERGGQRAHGTDEVSCAVL